MALFASYFHVNREKNLLDCIEYKNIREGHAKKNFENNLSLFYISLHIK